MADTAEPDEKPAELVIHTCTEATRSAFNDNGSASRAAHG